MRLFSLPLLFLIAGASCSSAAVTFSISTTAPTVNGADIAQLTSDSSAFGNGVIWGDRAARGQSFTTGSNVLGYQILSFTVQAAGAQNANGGYNLRVGTISGTSFSAIYSDSTGTVTTDVAANNYITFTFASPVTLAANTTYGVDVGRTASGYTLYSNTNSASYSGGANYTSGASGVGNTSISNTSTDLVFHLDMVAIPEPSTVGLLGLSGLLLLRRRRV